MPQLLEGGRIQYLVSRNFLLVINIKKSNLEDQISKVADYLSEITMSLLAAAKNKNPQVDDPGYSSRLALFCFFQLGFTPDFVESIAPHLGEIKR